MAKNIAYLSGRTSHRRSPHFSADLVSDFEIDSGSANSDKSACSRHRRIELVF
jgi:hypothetical protein